jgi:hypothetical protein
MPDTGMFSMDLPGLLALAIQVLLPLAVAFVTKQSWSGRLKAGLLLLATLVTQFLVGWADALNKGVAFDWKAVAYSIVVGFVISVAVHYGLWKSVGATTATQASGVKDKPITATPAVRADGGNAIP